MDKVNEQYYVDIAMCGEGITFGKHIYIRVNTGIVKIRLYWEDFPCIGHINGIVKYLPFVNG